MDESDMVFSQLLFMIIAVMLILFIIIRFTSFRNQKYDLAILNGRVMDPETNLDAIRNIGITNGKIAIITKNKIHAKQSINATGLVVSPGFIDTHTHASNDWGYKASLRDGVTTVLDTELGAINVGKWYAARKGKSLANYGTVVSQEFARMIVLDKMKLEKPYDAIQFASLRAKSSKNDGIPNWAVTVSSLKQVNEITKILDENLRQGALGVGSTIGYMAKGISTDEMFEAQRAAARYGRLTAAHVRFLGNISPPTEGTLGFDEVFSNAVALHAPLIASHNNNYGWWEVQEKLTLARKQGYNMWAEYYPYIAGSSSIGSEFLKPEHYLKFSESYEKTMFNPQTGKFMTEADYKEKVKKDPGFIIIVFIPSRKTWLPEWLKLSHVTVASDAMPPVDEKGNSLTIKDPYEKYNGHPRTMGTHAKVLRLGRKYHIPLMQSLRQLSYWSALHLGEAGLQSMQMRGRLQKGMVADITIFNPNTVTDNSDYISGKNGLPSTGIPFVIVNGVIVVKNSKIQDHVFPGKPIRYPIEKKGRFIRVKIRKFDHET